MTKRELGAVVVGVTVTVTAILLGVGTVRRTELIAMGIAALAFIGTVLVLGKADERR
jgi:hypothetical protein